MDEILKIFMENPNEVTSAIKEYINVYKPIVYELAQEVVEVYKDYSNNTEFPTAMAKIRKNMYDAYISAGFTEEQAFNLLLSDIQLAKNINIKK